MNDLSEPPPGRAGGPARRVRSRIPLTGPLAVAAALAVGALAACSPSPAAPGSASGQGRSASSQPAGGGLAVPDSPVASGPAAPTAPAPALSPSTAPASAGITLAAAEAQVTALGYTPYPDTGAHWNGAAPLAVILATATRSADGYNNWAFFFAAGHYIGTDTRQPSAGIRLAWARGAAVALTYVLYHPSDPLCCPSAGTATVRYRWTGSRLVALDPIPGAGSSDPTRN